MKLNSLKLLSTANSRFHFRNGFFELLIGLTIIFILGQFLLSFPFLKQIRIYFWGENNVLENFQFVFFFLGAFQSFLLSWKFYITFEKFYIWGFYFLFSLLLLFIGMEEIAWGQQFFHFNSPDVVKSFNVQNEFTLHNVEVLQDKTDILNLIFGLCAIVGLWLHKFRDFRRITIPPVLGIWVSIIVVLSGFGVLVDIISISSRIDYIIHKQTETVEFLIGIVGFLYPWLNYRLFIGGFSILGNIENSNIDQDGLNITFKNTIAYYIPPRLLKANIDQRPKDFESKNPKPDNISLPRPIKVKKTELKRFFYKNHFVITKTQPLDHNILQDLQNVIMIVASTLVLIWILSIPGDPKNAVFWGYSWTRLTMILAVIVFIVGITWLRKNHGLRRNLLMMVYKLLFPTPKSIEFGVISGGIGTITILIGIVYFYFSGDSYVYGILSRAAPILVLLSLVLLNISFWCLRISIVHHRATLPRAEKIEFTSRIISITLLDGIRISFPIHHLLLLKEMQKMDQENYVLENGGREIYWSKEDMRLKVHRATFGNPQIE